MVDTIESKQERMQAIQAKMGEDITYEQKAALDAQLIAIMSENVSDMTKALLSDRNITSAAKARAGIDLLREVQAMMRRKYGV